MNQKILALFRRRIVNGMSQRERTYRMEQAPTIHKYGNGRGSGVRILGQPKTVKMETADLITSIHQLATRLPFALGDTEEVNRRFEASMNRDGRLTDESVHLWTYCYVRRYFLIKFAKDPTAPIADFDMIVETTFLRIQRGKLKMKSYSRYANWVSVICKNTFLNYLRARKRKPVVALLDRVELVQEEEHGYDSILVRDAIENAIERLPEFLQDTARMRFLSGIPYEEIATRSGKSIPTVRSYVNKVLNRFRRDRQLIALLKDEVIP